MICIYIILIVWHLNYHPFIHSHQPLLLLQLLLDQGLHQLQGLLPAPADIAAVDGRVKRHGRGLRGSQGVRRDPLEGGKNWRKMEVLWWKHWRLKHFILVHITGIKSKEDSAWIMEDPVKCPFKQLWKRMEKSISTSEGKFQVNLCLKSTRTRQNLTSPKSVASKICASTINPYKKNIPHSSMCLQSSPVSPCVSPSSSFWPLPGWPRPSASSQPCHRRWSTPQRWCCRAPAAGAASAATTEAHGARKPHRHLAAEIFLQWHKEYTTSISGWAPKKRVSVTLGCGFPARILYPLGALKGHQRAPVPLAAMARMAAFKVTVSKRSFLRCRVDSRAKAFGQPASAWVACLWTTIPISLWVIWQCVKTNSTPGEHQNSW